MLARYGLSVVVDLALWLNVILLWNTSSGLSIKLCTMLISSAFFAMLKPFSYGLSVLYIFSFFLSKELLSWIQLCSAEPVGLVCPVIGFFFDLRRV